MSGTIVPLTHHF